MKKGIKYILLGILGTVLVILTYYLVTIFWTRSVTIEKFEAFLNSEKNIISIEELSEFQLNALLEVEDPNFYNHNGFDISTPGAGMTTITQSLVKRFYFDNFKQGIAKIKQTLIAIFAVDPLISKEDQLTVFINEYPFNDQAIGFTGAAKYYYSKDFEDITDDEYLSMVAMLIAPVRYDIRNNPENNDDRAERIKELLDGSYAPRDNSDVYYELTP